MRMEEDRILFPVSGCTCGPEAAAHSISNRTESRANKRDKKRAEAHLCEWRKRELILFPVGGCTCGPEAAAHSIRPNGVRYEWHLNSAQKRGTITIDRISAYHVKGTRMIGALQKVS